MHTASEISGETVNIHRLTWKFASLLYDHVSN